MDTSCNCRRAPNPSLMEVIFSEIVRGKGTPESISRVVIQIHCKHGILLAEDDPCKITDPTLN